jgi:hypothetical protein
MMPRGLQRTRPLIGLTVAQTQRLADCLRVAEVVGAAEDRGMEIEALSGGVVEVRVAAAYHRPGSQVWTLGPRGGLHRPGSR